MVYHISGHPSATGQAQDSESTPAKDRCYTAGPRNQHYIVYSLIHHYRYPILLIHAIFYIIY